MNQPTTLSDAPESPTVPNGPAWAAILAAATAGFTFGLLTDLSESSPPIARFLNWYHPAGTLSGVACSTLLLWAITWTTLHTRWHKKHLPHQTTLTATTCLLILLAFLATFPPFYALL